MSRFASGKAFEQEIAQTLSNIPNCFHYKFPDTHYYRAFRPEAIIPQVPSDFIVAHNGKSVYLECKSSRNKTSYNFDYIPQKQIDVACKISSCGVEYYFLICNRSKRNHHYLLVFTPLQISEINNYLTNINKRSMKWSELEKMFPFMYFKNKDNTYNLNFI